MTEDSENEMNKNVRIRLNEYLFNRTYSFTKRLKRVYIEGKEIGIKYETVLFFDRGKNIINMLIGSSEKRVHIERNIGIEYETVVALAILDN